MRLFRSRSEQLRGRSFVIGIGLWLFASSVSLVFATVHQFAFTTAEEFTFSATKIEVTSGVARLKPFMVVHEKEEDFSGTHGNTVWETDHLQLDENGLSAGSGFYVSQVIDSNIAGVEWGRRSWNEPLSQETAALAAVLSRLQSFNSQLTEARNRTLPPGGTDEDIRRPTREKEKIARLQSNLREITGMLKPVSSRNGMDLEVMYESINQESSNIGQLGQKADQLKMLLDLNIEMVERAHKESRAPITRTWYETGSVVLKILVVNPSRTETQTIPVRIYLPKEVSPENILDAGDMKVDYDEEKGMYLAHKEVELQPGESMTKMVRMKDIWMYPEGELAAFVTQAKEIAGRLQETSFVDEAAAFVLAVESKVQEILQRQKSTLSNPGEHIRAFREGGQIISSIKRDLSVLGQYEERASSKTSKGEKEGEQSLTETVTDGSGAGAIKDVEVSSDGAE